MAWPVQKALKDATIPGFPVVDRTGRTTIRGVWVAGNAADPRAQVITSAGSGSAAAIAINADLVQEDIVTACTEPSQPVNVDPAKSKEASRPGVVLGAWVRLH